LNIYKNKRAYDALLLGIKKPNSRAMHLL